MEVQVLQNGRNLVVLMVLLGFVFVLNSQTASANTTDIFISEYVEGSSFNKAIELYNGTGGAVDLAAGVYTLELYSNGSTTVSQSVSLTGTIADGDVFVICLLYTSPSPRDS